MPGAGAGAGAVEKFYSEPEPEPECFPGAGAGAGADQKCHGSASLDRCYIPQNFGKIRDCQVHHFSDASEVGYGAVTYLRIQNQQGQINCSFVMGKARVAPVKTVTIPRLELAAATVAVRLSAVVKKELEIPVDSVTFWTDNTTVLRYINNQTSRFKTYVANRVEQFLTYLPQVSGATWEQKATPQMKHPEAFQLKNSHIQNGLEVQIFLWNSEEKWPAQPIKFKSIDNCDPEVKKIALIRAANTEENPTARLLQNYSDWYRLKRAIAHIIKLTVILKKNISRKKSMNKETQLARIQSLLQVEDLKNAENAIINPRPAGGGGAKGPPVVFRR